MTLDPHQAIQDFHEAIESNFICERCGMTIHETKVQGVTQLPHKWVRIDHDAPKPVGTCDPWLTQLEKRLDAIEARLGALEEAS